MVNHAGHHVCTAAVSRVLLIDLRSKVNAKRAPHQASGHVWTTVPRAMGWVVVEDGSHEIEGYKGSYCDSVGTINCTSGSPFRGAVR